MTIEHMKNIAKEKMNNEIAFLTEKLTSGSEVRATLFAFFLVELFSCNSDAKFSRADFDQIKFD